MAALRSGVDLIQCKRLQFSAPYCLCGDECYVDARAKGA